MAGDLAAFLATVDPSNEVLLQQQQAWFTNLSAVPFASFDYVLDESRVRGLPALAADDRWAPVLQLRYSVAGVDDGDPVVQDAVLEFVQNGGAWYVGGTEAPGAADPRPNLWDHGPVVVARTAGVVALGHPGDEAELARLAGVAQAAVPKVTAVWGPDWSQRVLLLLPQGREEVQALVGDSLDLDRVAAIATAVLRPAVGDAVGERVVINPEPFGGLTPLGQQVVLTHEVTHVAVRDATGEHVPIWLAEGFADLVAYRAAGLSVTQAAAELGQEVRRGEVPMALPGLEDFADSDRLPAVYESAWLAVKLIADTTDDATLLSFYRAVSEAPGAAGVDDALRDVLGTDQASFVAAWQDSLRAQLG